MIARDVTALMEQYGPLYPFELVAALLGMPILQSPTWRIR